jgi:hypothetical protein
VTRAGGLFCSALSDAGIARLCRGHDTSENINSTARRCVYTSLIGGYEKLNKQPFAQDADIPFICLTDDPTLTSESWRIRLIAPVFAMDPIRSQRELKLRPHVYLSDFDTSLYIDNSVLLSAAPEAIFEKYAGASSLALARHSFRETVLDEFLEGSRLGFDDQGRIFEQLNHYGSIAPRYSTKRPFGAAYCCATIQTRRCGRSAISGWRMSAAILAATSYRSIWRCVLRK